MLAGYNLYKRIKAVASVITATVVGPLVATGVASEPCAPEFIANSNMAAGDQFDPLRDALSLHDHLTLRNPHARACSGYLTMKLDNVSDNWPSEAELVVRGEDGATLLRANVGTLAAVKTKIRKTLPPETSESLPISFSMTHSGPLLRSGVYRAAINVSLWANQPHQGMPIDEQSFKVSFAIEPSVRIALPAAAANASVPLGALSPGLSKSFSLLVTSTNPYSVTVTSQNGWILRRINGTDTLEEQVPYHFAIDGAQAIDTPTLTAEYGRAPAGTRPHNFKIVTGQFEFIHHGQYRDVLTVTVSARL